MSVRLLQINVEGNTGSTGRLVENIGNDVIKKGWDSFIAHGRFFRKSTSNIIKIGNKLDNYIHGFETRLFDRHGLGSRSSTRVLVNNIIKINPDIIHLHSLHGYYLNVQILFNFLKQAKIPVVWTFHDCWPITGHCSHFDFVGCNRWESVCHNCPQKSEYPASFIFDRSTKNYNLKKKLFNSVDNLTIVCVSDWLDTIVGRSFLANHPRTVIKNGINLNVFQITHDYLLIKNKLEIKNKFMILGVASPWSEKKGLSDFIKLSTLLPNDAVIVLVGLDNKQLINLPSNIIGLKKTESQKELADFYNSADLFINFSVEETFGLTTAEALSCGTPALVYKSTACPEIVDINTGFVISKGDLSSVLTVIDIIKTNGKTFYQKKCRDRAVALFDIKKMTNNYFELYTKILNKNFL
jgi:glycosyltransferase involved in cell wall biosynthesis